MLIVLMPLLFSLANLFLRLFYESTSAGNSILEDVVKRPALSITMLLGIGAGVSAFITGFIAIIKKKERTALVIGSTLLGALVILFLVAEVAFPY